MTKWNLNSYGNVTNGADTFKEIANKLKSGHSVFIGWEDKDTHYDILFTYGSAGEGHYQKGLRKADLFVSVISFGSFGFSIDNLKTQGYIAEKLFNSRLDSSVTNISKLINGIIVEMKEKV